MDNYELVIHGCFVNHSGYAKHMREFATALNKMRPVKVRNFAYEKDWSHLSDEQRGMIIDEKGGINIVLLETNHKWFYENYPGIKIAYNVWESTEQPQHFFDKLLEFDQLWVPTKWQMDCSIQQGFPKEKVRVVHEGVSKKFLPVGKKFKRFTYFIAGRWDYRKGIKECVEAFLKSDLDADLVLSADNPFPVDEMNSTEERLDHYGFNDSRIKVVHFPPDAEYLKLLQKSHVYLSCSRAEGWNLPLVEAMACGTPAIFSDHPSQLEYAHVFSDLMVRSKEMRKPEYVFNSPNTPGLWHEPNWDNLVEIIKESYDHYSHYQEKALKASEYIRENFTWEKAAEKAYNVLEEIKVPEVRTKTPEISTDAELYQDQWVNDKVLIKGKRDCEGRYEALKKVFDKYERPFTILDIGANFGYYSIRAATDYNAISIMVENKDNECERLIELAEKNNCRDNLIVLKDTMSLEKLDELSKCEHFDIVLALNVIHHFNDGVKEICDAFKKLGDYLIIETPPPDDEGACGQKNLQIVYDYFNDGEFLGEFKRHTSDKYSEVKYTHTPKTEIINSYWGWEDLYSKVRPELHYLLNKESLKIDSTFRKKSVYNPRKEKSSAWIHGINLKTFIALNGVYPTKDYLINKLKSQDLITDYKWNDSSNDIVLHNIIMEGHKLHLIDYDDDKVIEPIRPDDEQINGIIKLLSPPKIRLNAACGNDIKEEYLNVDLYNGNADVQWDITNMPVEDDCVDEIFASHVIEHFKLREVSIALAEWNRVLKIGGELVIKCPNLEYEVNNWLRAKDKWASLHLTIFGGSNHEGNFHHCGFTKESLQNMVNMYGFETKSCEFDGVQLILHANKISRSITIKPLINIHFIDGAYVHLADGNKYYEVDCMDKGGNFIHSSTLRSGGWTKTNRSYFTNWHVKVHHAGKILWEHKFDPTNRRVLIEFESKSLGDSLCWIPYVEEFRKKYNCEIFVMTYWNQLFRSVYTNLNFLNPGDVYTNIYAGYKIGCWEGNSNRNPKDWRTIPLQQIATDILGLEYKEIKPKIAIPKEKAVINSPYVCISEWSTLLRKHWMYKGGWQSVVDYLNEAGYKVVVVSKEPTNLKNIINQTNQPIEATINNINHCEFYIGIGHGPAWIAWALNKPVIMISGFSKSCEFKEGCKRITTPEGFCSGCFNDTSLPFDRGGWDNCPRNKDFECSRSITPEMVIETIDEVIEGI